MQARTIGLTKVYGQYSVELPLVHSSAAFAPLDYERRAMTDLGQGMQAPQVRGFRLGRLGRLLFALPLVISAMLGFAEHARAATHVSATTYTSNTTWTTTGSPYIIDGSVTVGSGVTLTIDPGVIVKLNGLFRYIEVEGTISAVGNSSNHITFTSINDDSIGGDSGGDGATSGAAGDWYMLWLNSTNSASTLDYVDVRYGGYGSGDYSYGSVKVTNSAVVNIDHSTITHSLTAGLLVGVGSDPGAIVDHSTFSENGTGVAVNQAHVTLRNNSHFNDNSRDGIFFNLSADGPSGYSGPQSTVMHSEMTGNGRYGVNLQVSASIDASIFPSGNYNNIYANDGFQIDHSFYRNDVDWEDNYLDSEWEANPLSCASTPVYSLGSQSYLLSKGPITWAYYTVDHGPYVPPDYCYYDKVVVINTSPSPIDNSGY
jgi:hypothetical protein